MATVIDSLLVTLGLDPTPYKKGAADAERSQKALTTGTKKAGQEMQAAFMGVARQIGLLVLGFESFRGALNFLGNINNTDAALGRLAANTGQNVQELKLWSNAVELAGGEAKDAQADILNLSDSLTQVQTQGTTTPLYLLMNRLGVAAQDVNGKLKPMTTLLDEIGAGLRKYDRRTAFNIGSAAGLSQGTLHFLLAEEATRKRIMAQAAANNGLNEAAAKRAQEIQERWRGLKQSAEDLGRVLLEKIQPGLIAFFDALAPIKPILVDIIDKLADGGAFEAAANAIVKIAEFAERAVDALLRLKGVATGETEATVAGQAVDEQGNPLRGSRARLAEMKAADAAEARDTQRATIRASEVAAERAQFGVAAAARLFQEQERLQGRDANQTVSVGGGGTTVQIDNITVNTQATDAEGVAAELPGALRRKGIVAQADSGMN